MLQHYFHNGAVAWHHEMAKTDWKTMDTREVRQIISFQVYRVYHVSFQGCIQFTDPLYPHAGMRSLTSENTAGFSSFSKM